jgi:Family of unknown function (DUF6788)
MVYQLGMSPNPLPRSHRPAEERDARSRLVKRCADAALLRGSLVTMRRVCGKPGCHCASGEKHDSLDLAIRVEKRRKLIYIPRELEERVREWVQSSQEIDRLLELISQSCLEQLLQSKRNIETSDRKGNRPRKD